MEEEQSSDSGTDRTPEVCAVKEELRRGCGGGMCKEQHCCDGIGIATLCVNPVTHDLRIILATLVMFALRARLRSPMSYRTILPRLTTKCACNLCKRTFNGCGGGI